MARALKSFKVRIGIRWLDYRLGENLDLLQVRGFFEKSFEVKSLKKGSRHIQGVLAKDGSDYFLKLSTSEGISVVSENEYAWNEYFNKYFFDKEFFVPKNYSSGYFKDRYFYLITDYLGGELICRLDRGGKENETLAGYIPKVIRLFEKIQKLPSVNFTKIENKGEDYKKRFLNKTRNWFEDIPAEVRKGYDIGSLLQIVEKGTKNLLPKPRHGDFTPWHMIRLADGAIGLIDGEHALVDGVEYYDICYFIQRVFSVLNYPDIAKKILSDLLQKGYEKDKLRIVLAARAVGGFLDESLGVIPRYDFADSFREFVVDF